MLPNYSGFHSVDALFLNFVTLSVYVFSFLFFYMIITNIKMMVKGRKNTTSFKFICLLAIPFSFILSLALSPILIEGILQCYSVLYELYINWQYTAVHSKPLRLATLNMHPDMALAEYMIFREWKSTICADTLKIVMDWRIHSRNNLFYQAVFEWEYLRNKRHLIGVRDADGRRVFTEPRRQTWAVWFYNASTFIPVSPDLRVQFGYYQFYNFDIFYGLSEPYRTVTTYDTHFTKVYVPPEGDVYFYNWWLKKSRHNKNLERNYGVAMKKFYKSVIDRSNDYLLDYSIEDKRSWYQKNHMYWDRDDVRKFSARARSRPVDFVSTVTYPFRLYREYVIEKQMYHFTPGKMPAKFGTILKMPPKDWKDIKVLVIKRLCLNFE